MIRKSACCQIEAVAIESGDSRWVCPKCGRECATFLTDDDGDPCPRWGYGPNGEYLEARKVGPGAVGAPRDVFGVDSVTARIGMHYNTERERWELPIGMTIFVTRKEVMGAEGKLELKELIRDRLSRLEKAVIEAVAAKKAVLGEA